MYPYGYPVPMAPPIGPDPAAALSAEQRKLPGSVRAAGIMMISFGLIYMALVTIVILAGDGSTALWLNILSYVIAAVSVAVPILMLMRKRWAYSLSVSILVAAVLLFALDVISSGLWFQVTALPIVVLLIVFFALIYGIPLMLLMGKSARRAFEGERSLSAAVWSGGGWQIPGTEPVAYHPSELPPYLLWMRQPAAYFPPAMAYYPPPPAYVQGGGQWPPSWENPGGMQYSS